MTLSSLSQLPADLPRPLDDGAADHLEGTRLPTLVLEATDGAQVDLRSLPGRQVIYVYPRTGRPDVPLPENWDRIPGARGCTPQSCGFRDLHSALQAQGVGVFGLSTQDGAYQREARDRLQLPFQLLSDTGMLLKQHLQLPTFVTGGMELYKRLTFIIEGGRIVKVFYPVFPPDLNAQDVLAWLHTL